MDAVVSMYHVSCLHRKCTVPPRVPSGPVMYKLDMVVLAMGNFDAELGTYQLYSYPPLHSHVMESTSSPR